VGFIRTGVARRLGAIAVFVAAAGVTGCGAKDVVTVNEPLPANTVVSFDVQKISGMNYTGAGESFLSAGGIRINIMNSVLTSVTMFTHCGGGGTSGFELIADRFVVRDFVNSIDPAKCTPEQFAAVERVRVLMSSSPRYRFDGDQLQLISDKTTVTLTLVETQNVVIDSEGGISSGTRSRG
jgi:hypothetical protein